MRRLTVAISLSAMALAPACKRAASHLQAVTELLSVVTADDPRANAQLVRGFYSPEGGPWRWTARQFSVTLRPPPGSSRDGARLELKLNIPDVVTKQLGAVTLSATAAGNALEPEKYSQPGDYVYARAVPASALAGSSVTIEFAVDKAIPAGKIEKRELALIVSSIGLVPK